MVKEAIVKEKESVRFWRQVGEAMELWPNRCTLLRILSLPILYWLAIEQYRIAFGIVFALAAVTDLADGMLSRTLHQSTPFGARFDSIADQLFQCSMLAWVYFLSPEVFRIHGKIIFGSVLFVIVAQSIQYTKSRRWIDFHTYLSKASAFFWNAFVFVIALWAYQEILFWVVVGVLNIATMENILLSVCFNPPEGEGRSLWYWMGKRK